MAKKTTCPISRETFREKCKGVKVNIEGKEFEVDPKEFSTGSLGWYLNTKVNLQIDGVSVPVVRWLGEHLLAPLVSGGSARAAA